MSDAPEGARSARGPQGARGACVRRVGAGVPRCDLGTGGGGGGGEHWVWTALTWCELFDSCMERHRCQRLSSENNLVLHPPINGYCQQHPEERDSAPARALLVTNWKSGAQTVTATGRDALERGGPKGGGGSRRWESGWEAGTNRLEGRWRQGSLKSGCKKCYWRLEKRLGGNFWRVQTGLGVVGGQQSGWQADRHPKRGSIPCPLPRSLATRDSFRCKCLALPQWMRHPTGPWVQCSAPHFWGCAAKNRDGRRAGGAAGACDGRGPQEAHKGHRHTLGSPGYPVCDGGGGHPQGTRRPGGGVSGPRFL